MFFHRSQHPVPFTGGHVTCHVCGATYANRNSLAKHMKMHSGQTLCPHCHQAFAGMYTLRRHMVSKHGMSREEVDMVTNKGYRLPRNYWTPVYNSQVSVVPKESDVAAASPATTVSTAPTTARPAGSPHGDVL